MKRKLIKIIKAPSFITDGMLTQLQYPDVPFEIKRVYFIQGVSEGAVRGAHAHVETIQALFCIQGSIKMVFDDGKVREEIILDKPNVGVLLEPGVWHEMQDFKKDTIILVLASKEYEPKDYIRSYEDFLNFYAGN
ncbi:MAG: dTDP-6-deoxy-3,4-keto-hexulose isomerase [Patescibacteria group bacterium]|nr:MAG: dTDP-6-deoxy-3,4-keto-hexulose isomerase [Patescibacteria group bacterium]